MHERWRRRGGRWLQGFAEKEIAAGFADQLSLALENEQNCGQKLSEAPRSDAVV